MLKSSVCMHKILEIHQSSVRDYFALVVLSAVLIMTLRDVSFNRTTIVKKLFGRLVDENCEL